MTEPNKQPNRQPSKHPKKRGGVGRWPHAMPIDELRQRYLVEKQSLRAIAAAAGITVQAVRLRCIAHGIPRRSPGGANATGKRWRWSR